MPRDKQLRNVTLDEVVEKRSLDQALNAKEFAVLAAISYSAARDWFRQPGFPVFRGVVFWQDFVEWRRANARFVRVQEDELPVTPKPGTLIRANDLPPRAARILIEAD
jgi:hypothetical protein